MGCISNIDWFIISQFPADAVTTLIVLYKHNYDTQLKVESQSGLTQKTVIYPG